MSRAHLIEVLCCAAQFPRYDKRAQKLVPVDAPEKVAEIAEIPCIKGLRELPPAVVPIVAALAGAVEEVFFRGVLLLGQADFGLRAICLGTQ